jgi:hypothetical protein
VGTFLCPKNVKIFHPIYGCWQAQHAFGTKMLENFDMLKNHPYYGLAYSVMVCHHSVMGGF